MKFKKKHLSNSIFIVVILLLLIPQTRMPIQIFVHYIIAMLKSKNTRWHVAFIIASSLVLLNPGLGRMIAALSDRQTGLLVMIITPYLVLLCILFFEKIKYKRPILKSPFALIFLLFMMEFFLFALIVSSKFWRDFIDKLAASY